MPHDAVEIKYPVGKRMRLSKQTGRKLTVQHTMCINIHMRTNIVLDDVLVREAAAITGLRSKKELIHRALQVLIQKEHENRQRAQYDERILDIQQRTAGLALRERPHQIVRADRERR